ncbi:protein-tyrosine-phosphatase [Spirochaetia bacterium]|nr:protein-tyrosine-phosphatase [Spirochaetia bacterium]
MTKWIRMNDSIMENNRCLPVEGLYNVRDLGGYCAGDRQVRWGVLYRAGDLANLTVQARGFLETLNIKTIVDFRFPTEQEQSPDGEISTVVNTYSLPIDAGNTISLSRVGIAADAEDLMTEIYRAMVEEARPKYRTFFRLLEDREKTPLLFHCAAGKDRTGVGAALVLSALGVDRETIFQDYLLSVECLKDKYRRWIEKSPHQEPLMTVRRRYLAAAFDQIDSRFGGMDKYLREELGADIVRLRELYTINGT